MADIQGRHQAPKPQTAVPGAEPQAAAGRSVAGRYVAALKSRKPLAIIGTIIAAAVVIALIAWPLSVLKLHLEDNTAAEAMRKTPVPAEQAADPGIDWETLRGRNPEIYAWLYVPGTEVNLPVLQHNGDDAYYLNHNQWGENSGLGSVFSEMRNGQSFTDPVTVLYGHDVASIFKNLHRFEDTSFFDKHDTFYIYTPAKHKLTYRIVSAYRSDDSHILNTHDFSKESGRSDYFKQVLHPTDSISNVRSGAALKPDDKVLQLSTCMLNEFHGAHRYIVTGVLEHDEVA